MKKLLAIAGLAALAWAIYDTQIDPKEHAEPSAGARIDWTQSRSLETRDLDSQIVRCSLPDGVLFMLDRACRARGGRPGPVGA